MVKYGIVKGIPESEALQVCRELYGMREVAWPKDFVDLDLTDIQFQLCEFAKYMKVKLGVGKPKRIFRPTIDEVTCHISTRQKCSCGQTYMGEGECAFCGD